MKVLTHDFFGEEGRKGITIVPLGDIHIGHAACDESRLQARVQEIKERGWYFIGMGDLCEFIPVRDPRFTLDGLADWVEVQHLGDIVSHERARLMRILEPIADRCLGMVSGNHERKILDYYERDVHREMLEEIRRAAGWDAKRDLDLGVGGWLRLRFYRSENDRREGVFTVKMIAHHGFTGGRLAGAKALSLQRWLWTHDADVILFGHSHNTSIQIEAVEYLDRAGNVRYKYRVGAYTGTFLASSVEGKESYSERKGYLPLPTSGVEIQIKPSAKRERIQVRLSM